MKNGTLKEMILHHSYISFQFVCRSLISLKAAAEWESAVIPICQNRHWSLLTNCEKTEDEKPSRGSLRNGNLDKAKKIRLSVFV